MSSLELVPVKGKLRLMLAVPRSGSTLFMQIMSGHPDISVTSRNILMGYMRPRDEFNASSRPFKPDYSLFTDPLHPVSRQFDTLGTKLLISKEEYGNDRNTGNPMLNECNYRIIPHGILQQQLKPLYTFRNPINVFDSWLARGWSDLDSFLLCYETALKSFYEAVTIDPDTLFYTYDYMVSSEQAQVNTFQKICDYWGIDFYPEMLDLRERKLGKNFIYRSREEQKIYTDVNPKGIFNTVKSSSSVLNNIKSHNLISADQKTIIEEELMNSFIKLNIECAKMMEQAANTDLGLSHGQQGGLECR